MFERNGNWKLKTVFLMVFALLTAALPAWAATPKIAAGNAHTVAIMSDGTLWAWGDNVYGQLGDGTTVEKASPVQIGIGTTWSKISANSNDTVAIKSDGTLWAWGDNSFGQLGDGTTVNKNVPVQIGTGTTWSQVSANSNHTVALKSDGTLWAWGLNSSGQLGDGTVVNKTAPVQIGTGTTWSKISAGYAHSIALKSDGTLWAWGRNNLGQLGDGTVVDKNAPVQIGTGTTWSQVSSGGSHTVALKSDGTLWVWGNNSYGQLGDGTVVDKNAPVQIGTGATWSKIEAGSGHTVALKSDGTFWAWGYNYFSQLGDGTAVDKNAPVQIGTSTTWSQVSSGGSHTVALKSDGTLWVWGWNLFGQVGDGTTVNKTTPVQITTVGTDWMKVSSGVDHTVALKSNGTLWAWGQNDWGQLGDGTATAKYSPVQIGIDTRWVFVSAKLRHTIALKSDGTLWGWGQNGFGQLGDGTTVAKYSPVQIGTDNRWISVSTGTYHTAAIRSDGTLWAWGQNDWGQLGDGTTVAKYSPVQIGTDNKWTSVSTGAYHTAAIRSDGTLWAWGSNWYGEVGDGTTTNRYSPVQIGPDTNWTSMSVGFNDSIAIKSNGTLWAWGRNEFGQLGDGTTVSKNAPVQIGPDTNWISISAGNFHSEALRADGTLWAWGQNGLGQLGDGTYLDKTAPVKIGVDTTWFSVAAGGQYTMALKSDGTLWAWGWNGYGQLGDGTIVPRFSPVQIGTADTTQPTGTISINSGAASTNSTSTTLTLSCTDAGGCAEMQFSNDNTNWSTAEAYATSKAWTLTAGDGTKTVYVKFKDTAGNWSIAYSDTILLASIYTVTPSAGTGGSITPNTPQAITYGTTTSFTVTPNGGYQIASVTGCGGMLSGNTYITSAITADCTVTATFSAIVTPAAPSLLVANGNSILNFNASTGAFIGTFTSGGSLSYATGMTMGPDGNLYVSDFSSGNILKYNGNTGSYMGVFANAAINAYAPVFGPDGNLYVGKSGGNILRFNGTTGASLGTFGQAPLGGDFGGMTFHNGYLFVTYLGNGSLYQFNATTGALVNVLYFGFSGNGPRAPIFGPDGNMYVPDWQTSNVKKFSGTTYAFLGNIVSNAGISAKSVAFSPDGNLLVLDDPMAPNRVVKFDINTGASLGTLIATGSGGLNRSSGILMVYSSGTDTTPPSGIISINSGAASTSSTSVTLTLSCTDTGGCSQMQFSNNNSSWSTPETYGTSINWTLTTGDSTKTVYVKFKDGAGNWSIAYSDTILLDTTAPTTTASPVAGTYTSAQSVTLSCSDGAGSGCGNIYYTTDDSTPTTSSTAYSSPITIPATTTLKFFAKDLAGNSEAVQIAVYTIGATPPSAMPYARSDASSRVINGVLYVAGGNDGSTDTATLQAYNPLSNSWSSLASMPGGRYQGASGVINGKLYVAGGWDNTSTWLPHNTLYIYDPTTNTWTSGANMPTLSACGTGTVVNGKLYVTSPCNGNSGWTNNLHVYDPAANTWTQLASMSSPHTNGASRAINGKIYLAGGSDGSGNIYSNLDVYDPATNTWSALAPMPAAVAATSSVVIGNRLYVMGGSNSTGAVSTVYIYDPVTNTWSSGSSLSLARQRMSTGLINGTVYIAGGVNASGSVVSTVEAYTPSAITDTTPPTGSISINGGAVSTPSRGVRLHLPCSDADSSCSHMRFSQDGTWWSPWEPYTAVRGSGVSQGDGIKTIFVQFNDNAGNVSTSFSDTITLAVSASKQKPRVAFDGTNYLMIWDDSRNGDANWAIYGRFISTSGTFVGVEFVVASGLPNQSAPKLSYGGGRYLVTWSSMGNAYGQVVSTSGALIGAEMLISSGLGSQLITGFDGTNYLTIWQRGSVGTEDIFGRFISPEGVAVGGEFAITTATSQQKAPQIAFDGSRYLVVWEDDRNGVLDIYGRFVSTTGGLIGNDFAISGAYNFQARPNISFDGSNYLVVWEDYRSGTRMDIYGQMVSITGSLVGSAIPISTYGSDTKMACRIAYNGTDRYLAVWADDRSGASTMDIYGQFVSTSGALLGSEFAISTAANDQSYPSVAGGGTSFLVAWEDLISGTNYEIGFNLLNSGISDSTPPTTTASPAGGTYTSAQSVTLTCSDGAGSGCGNIYYTTNGTTPDIFSTVYTVPINISANTTLKYFAVDLSGNGELVKTAIYTIVSGIGIDLTVSSLSAPVSAATGTNISIPNTIRNQGTVTSTTSYVKFYLSSDTVIDATTDVYLAQRSVGSLAAGASSSATTSLKIPVSVAPGTYYIGAIADATNTNTESDETNNTASTTAITVSSGVDLTVSSFSAPLSIATGVNVSVSNTVRNLGTGATVTSYVKFYLSTDAAIDSSDTYLTQRSIGALAGGASSSASTTIKLPVTLSPGTYYIGAIADETNTNIESDETNNKAVSGAITVTSGVDLAVSTFSVPSSIETGTSVVVSNTVTNNGVGATATSYLKIYLSTDSTIDSSDTYITQRSVSSLNGGLSSSASTTIKLPVTLSSGTYYIGAIADETNTNVESDETNNKAVSGAITVTSGVDLVVSSLSVPSTIETGVNVTLSNTVANLGPGATATSYLKIYLSTDSTIDSSDTYLSQRSVGSIAGGASSSANTTIKLPVTLSPGTYYIGAIADATNTNIESDETNNTAFTAAITVTVQSGIDFVVSSFSAPSTIYTGTNVSISNTVTNNGVGTSTTSYVKFYLSTDAAIDSSDTYITQRSVSSLNGGLSSSASTTIKLPVTLFPGTYYIGAIADETNTNVESDETNNKAVSGAITVLSGADLVVSTFSVPSSIETGTSVVVSNTVTNSGVGATATSYLKIYLSTDSTIDSSDTYITQRSVSSLAGGGLSSANTTIKLPVTLSPGTYYIGAIADETNTNIESDETNNKAVSDAITVLSGADLVVSAFNVPSTITTGLNATIDNTVTNNGVGASATSYLKIYLSTDANIDSSDTYLTQRSISSLIGGASSTANTTIKLPVTLSPGTYYIGAIADETNTNVESDETNNKAVSGAITVLSGADIVVSSLSAPSTIETGVNVSLSTTVTNNGVGATGTSYLKIYLSTDSTIDSSDTYLSQRSVSSIAGGASSSASTTIKLPVTLNPGTYYIGAIADETNTNVESDETNNKAVSGAITVTSGVDLTVSTLSAPGSAVAGTNVSVSNTVINNGTGTSSSSYVYFYLSTDATINSTDTYLGSRSIGGLAGGSSSSSTTSLKIPLSAAPGTYYIGAIADATGTNLESNETNNTGTTALLTVTSP